MENKIELVLPAEISEIAKNVSTEKRNEVQTVLNHVFNGVSKMREQLDSISVKDQNDEVSMKLAGTIRLAVKRERLDAEKKFDIKRAEIQQEMLGAITLICRLPNVLFFGINKTLYQILQMVNLLGQHLKNLRYVLITDITETCKGKVLYWMQRYTQRKNRLICTVKH